MAAQLNNLDTRISVLHSVLTKKGDQQIVAKALHEANGNWAAARASLTNMAPATLTKLDLAHNLGNWTDGNIPVITALANQPGVTSLRDLALNFNTDKLAAAIDPAAVPDAAQRISLASTIHTNLFLNETSAVLQRMAQTAELPIADTALSAHVATFLGNMPDFNIRTTSIYTALQNPDALKGIPDAMQAAVVAQMKILSLVQGMIPVPEAAPVLMKANLTSHYQVAEIPEALFLSTHGAALGGVDIARQVYTSATNSRIRNEHTLMSMHESVRGAGMQIIDGPQSKEMRLKMLQRVADKHGVQLNLESLFGGTDYCECGECLSVYSPASYFVEVLNYLRNNNLGPDPKNPGDPNPATNPSPGIRPNPRDISNTPLEKLFRRRPDLGCLELTCENTFTVLPYIDLVNEVMESFIVHLGNYQADNHTPKQAFLDVFNVGDETSGELLAQPQHINYEAYCILKSAVYPFTLPYHQPIDATRIFLNYLGTSRYELLDTFRAAHECAADSAKLAPTDKLALQTLHDTVLDRAADAEFLGLTQEEYIILTKEAFWPKHYFEITLNRPSITDADYQNNIGVKPVWEYYGYTGASGKDNMHSLDESPATGHKGLTFVRDQFLKRTGILYVDLVEMLKTRFINPDFPQGKALTILESIRFSYRFLQSLVNTGSTDPGTRFGTLIDFLEKTENLVPLLEARLHPDPCKQKQKNCCDETQDLRLWVYCYFERIGKLIVLDSGESPMLVVRSREGKSFTVLEGEIHNPNGALFGFLRKDGTIFDASQTNVIGQVTCDLKVDWKDGKTFADLFGKDTNSVPVIGNSMILGRIGPEGVSGLYGKGDFPASWTGVQDTCDLKKVRLIHLDGSALVDDEYDRMQRFIRLWRKLGWTIDETDKALTGAIPGPGAIGANGTTAGGTAADSCKFVGFDEFKDDCVFPDGGSDGACCDGSGTPGNWPCPDPVDTNAWNITPNFLHQLAAVRKLLDQTGLPLPKLLTFWADISTAGDKSLYSKLFLTHNLIAIDKVFKADKNGNYLTQSATITDHLPVLMAAFKLKADDIAGIMKCCNMTDTDPLTLSCVSEIYRYSLLAKILHVKPADLAYVIDLFGSPFLSPQNALDMLKTWGKMEDAGFTFRKLNYLVKNRDDALHPLAPALKNILRISKTLYDGLNGIDRDNPDIPDAQATDDLVRGKAGLLFEQTVVEKIMGLLDGTTVYTTNAPAKQTITIPDALAKKLKYINQKDAVPPAASIQVTGILTAAELALATPLCAEAGWPKALGRAAKQARNIFNEALSGIFPDQAAALLKLLAGDVNASTDPQDLSNTSSIKRVYFLKYFLPFLRQTLAHRLIVATMSGAAGLAPDIADILLTDILVVGSPAQSAMAALKAIKNKPAGSPAGWKGYLIPPANDAYTFIAMGDTLPPPLVIDGQTIPFKVQQDDPSDVWYTDPATPVTLKAGKLYWLELSDRPADQLQWKTASSSSAAIPSSALLPDFSRQGTEEAFVKLYKSALLVNGFSLDADETSYWQNHATDFDGFDFNALSLQHWKRVQAYTDLRNNLPKTETRLLDLFKWATNPDKSATLSGKIADATLWKQENIDKLLTAEHFDLNDPANFRNEASLVKMSKALAVAGKIGIDIDRLFDWAVPGSKFWECHLTAESIRNAIRSRFNEDDWEQVVKPLNDQLRENQKQALISYLLVQQDLIDWGVEDADSLFEFFLIDVQMGACMETSRIKQAISSVQLFVQRCMLGLEADYGVPNDALDRDRWNWMQKYRVWEANRKVYLYPENWIEPSLRDDKSPFYKELESELLQKDINTQNVQDALKNYLFKVDEVANLNIVGLFLEQYPNSSGTQVPTRLHVFGRTRNAPYFFYYRFFDMRESNWYPWEKVQVDIPNYDMEDTSSDQVAITENGAYLIPVVWNKRLLIFFPQLQKKTASKNSQIANKTFKQIGDDPANNHKPVEYLEIKMGWSEYRNQKWTQKQLSADAVYDIYPPFDVNNYRFAPRIITGTDARVVIEIFWSPDDPIGKFHFTGSQLFKNDPSSNFALLGKTDFDVNTANLTIHSLQATDAEDPRPLMDSEPYFTLQNNRVSVQNQGVQRDFTHPFVHQLLGKLATSNLDELFDYYLNSVQDKADAFGDDGTSSGTSTVYNELKRPYSLYNWEIAFHAPMQLVDRMLKAQQFDQALNMIHYVLDPSAKGMQTDDKRFWQFPPFKEIDASDTLDKLFLGLKPNQPDDRINEWRNKPFQPHVIARSRPSAYMKYVAMKYVEILIAYGDYYFRQFTLETIPLAIQCYVLASHVYGPRGQKIPRRGKVQPQTYLGLLDKWDAFGNAVVEMELMFPFSNQTPLPFGASNGKIGFANIFGFATTLYFCIPDNPQLKALRDTIDDRLFKIRHCQDIEGVTRKLPLFEPPIDPALLVQAAAQGLSLSSVLNDLSSPMPNYRFYYLLQKALELCGEVKALGNAFLSAKEKGDAEALSLLRAGHESSIQNLVMAVKKLQLDESQKSLDALQQSRLGPVSRMQYYLKLIGEDASKVPDVSADFSDLPNQLEQPVDESGLKLIGYEKEEMDKAHAAKDWQTGIGAIETLASVLHIIPIVQADAMPFGMGVGVAIGGTMLGNAAQAVARGLQIHANDLTYQSTSASRKGSFLRQLQDRVQQANTAGYEIKHIDKQILAQQIRIEMSNQEITNQQTQIDNAKEVEDFLRGKYTNQELYSWMEGQVRTLYYQAYTLAYDLAKRADKVFRFERGLSSDTANFIQFGYWDAGHDGLMSGERLYMGLKQLEAAYQEKRGYDFEISTPFSLRQINPLALMQLKENGICEFSLPEVLFDMARPGDYMRRIKSVALTVPCIVGPYTGLSCTLRLLEHEFRTQSIVKDKNDYPKKTDETDERFSTVNVPITSIATSTGQNDSGVFELNFKDERYLPFEGAGAISKWRLELPAALRQFDYDTITDVIIHLRHTAIDGGDKLKQAATDFVKDYINGVVELSKDEGLFAVFDLRHDFPNEWYKATHPGSGATNRVLALDSLVDRLPIFTKGWKANKIVATDLYLFTSSALSAASLNITTASGDLSFADAPKTGDLKSFASHDNSAPMSGWQLQLDDVSTPLDKLWMVVRYVLTK